MAYGKVPEYTILPRKKTVNFESEGATFQMYAGLYLMYGKTGVGKSIASNAIAMTAGKKNVAWYAHANEPTGRDMNEVAWLALVENTSLQTSAGEGTPRGALLVVDSINDILIFAQGKENQPTFPRGLMPAHIELLKKMQAACYEAVVTCIAVINSELFPVSDLEGSAEGKLVVHSPGVVEKRDRGDDRSFETIYLSKEIVDLSAVGLLLSGRRPSTEEHAPMYSKYALGRERV